MVITVGEPLLSRHKWDNRNYCTVMFHSGTPLIKTQMRQ
jgi:hypothetical protein